MTTNTEETELKISDCQLIVLHEIAAVSDIAFDVLLSSHTPGVYLPTAGEMWAHCKTISFSG